MIEEINGTQFGTMITSAAAAIEAARQAVNELNVFPVPDGDTGTNMSMTMSKAATEISKSTPEDVGRSAQVVAEGLLHGARGNSGVILSLLFRGFAKNIRDYRAITGLEFASALQDGVDAAYRAVMKPTEGTILTVARMAARRAAEAATENSSVEFVLGETLEAANEALAETIHQNPVLQKAGVIDAGGKGFCIILEGMLCALRGEAYVFTGSGEDAPRESAVFSDYDTEDILFTYCTEFIVSREGANDPRKLGARLSTMGDSLVFVDDDRIIKVHVHTNHPGKVLEEALKYGPLATVKIENMREQHSHQVINEQPARKIAAPEKRFGFVVVCAGDGLYDVFRDLGADEIISGGQTMNPSTEDILAAIDKTPAEVVFVFPNNKNIIMAAEQCAPLTDKELVVLPSRSVPQGISALLGFDPGLETEPNREAMLAAMSLVRTGQVTYAARESSFDGHDIREGDYMALLDDGLLTTHKSQDEVLTQLAREMNRTNPTYVTIFTGEGVDDALAGHVNELLTAIFASAEINLIHGGQPVYSFLISAE